MSLTHITCSALAGPSRHERRSAGHDIIRLPVARLCARTNALRAAVYSHIEDAVRAPEAPDAFMVRPLGSPTVLFLSLSGLLDRVQPSDLASCLAQHPRQAVQFLLGRLELAGDLVLSTVDHDAATGGSVGLRHDAAPHDRADAVASRHLGPSFVGSRNLGTIEGERKRHCRGFEAREHLATQFAGLFLTVAILIVLAFGVGAL